MFFITPTSRLAYYINHTQTENKAISLSEWLEQLWQTYVAQGGSWQRISALQSTLLWQQEIEKAALPLLHPSAVLGQVRQAWQWVQQWEVPLDEIKKTLEEFSSYHTVPDAAFFLKWATAYITQCLEKKWVDEAQLPAFLVEHLNFSSLSGEFYLYGFDYITPQLNRFINALQSPKYKIRQYRPSAEETAALEYYHYPDQQSEWRAAASWAKNIIEKESHLSPSIGIVIPNLTESWQSIHNIFKEIHSSSSKTAEKNHLPFNLDAGLVLKKYPLIQHTLLLLKGLFSRWSYPEMSVLLRSPFMKGQEDYFYARNRLTAKWLKSYSPWFTSSILKNKTSELDPILQSFFERLSNENWGNSLYPSEWVSCLNQLFEASEWPRGRERDPAEIQIWERFQKLLDHTQGLDTVCGSITFSEFFAILENEASHIFFQARTEPAPIQVMGVLETLGMSFDYLWVCGLHEESWPPAAKPNPFLPIALQRKHGLPHASHKQEQEYAKQFMVRWKNSARHLICSYASSEQQDYLPSALIDKLLVKKDKISPVWEIDVINQSLPLSMPEVVNGLPIQTFKAGTALLKDQAECPFRAYARHRLGLHKYSLDEIKALGNAMLRGIVIHRALQLVWEQLQNQKNLLSLSESQLKEGINKSVEQAIREEYKDLQEKESVPDVFLEVERDRISIILGKWLEKEKLRSDFSIHELESARLWELEGLIFNMRIDRIDKTETGYYIVDYKTGRLPSTADYDRLIEAQMPLYALSTEGELSAVVFAKIMGEGTGFSGWVKEKASLPALTSKSLTEISWDEQLENWKNKAQKLINEFKQGYAQIEPYPNEAACSHCNLHAFCRVGHD